MTDSDSGVRSQSSLVERDGELYYLRDFLASDEAETVFGCLQSELDWHEEEIVIVGRRVMVPRLVCWYGDTGAVYRYSGVDHTPLPWTEHLLDLRRRVERVCGMPFNSVLGNLYRDGNDSMGWHADNEKSLGDHPAIASLSLGSERLFRLRHTRTGQILDLPLAAGSLLLMAGSLQHHWRHCLPKAGKPCGPRINLTFRRIFC